MNKVYVRWNPLYERVVCVHSSEEMECKKCIKAREDLESTPYSLEGEWFKIDSDSKLCYCGNPVDETNPDCVEFDLCKEHAADV